MTFIESPWFCEWRDANLSDEAFHRIQLELLRDPTTGVLLRGTGGLRKLRVRLHGRGKRGGGRVIYYHWAGKHRCYLLYGFAKNVTDDLTPEQLHRLGEVLREDLDDG